MSHSKPEKMFIVVYDDGEAVTAPYARRGCLRSVDELRKKVHLFPENTIAGEP